jgi:RNA polymerase sigma-70 factor (ECF subfamily)
MVTDEFDWRACLEQVEQRDEDAARALVERLYPLVIRIVRSHLPRRTAEEDLAQEVFVKMFRRLEQYQARPGTPFEHWVARLAVRTCLDALKAADRRPELRWADLSEEQAAWLDFMLADQSVTPEASAASARELIEQLLSQLPPDDRLVISLIDLQEKTVREVSEMTGWSGTLVKVRAFRARRKLRKLAQSVLKQDRYAGL